MGDFMKKIKWTELLIFVIGTELAGAISGLLAGDFSAFYSTLTKPPLSPPGVVFPVVWAILYAVMGVSAYLVYTSEAEESEKGKELILYGVQLLVNVMWSIVFFRFEKIGLALGVLILLAVLVSAMILRFRKIRAIAGYINIPYLLWTLFALYLNIGFVVLN